MNLSVSMQRKHFGKLSSVPKSNRVKLPRIKNTKRISVISKSHTVTTPIQMKRGVIVPQAPVYKGYGASNTACMRYNVADNSATVHVYGM